MDKSISLAPMPDYIKRVYERGWLVLLLLGVCYFTTAFTSVAYALTLIGLAFGDLSCAIGLIIVTLVPFVGVTVFRNIVGAPRPSELYDLSSLGEWEPKKKNRSFPSRHVFSSFAIGTALCFVQPIVGAVVLVLGVALGACRVLLGYHFPRDVVAGGLIGAISGVVGMLIVNII